MRRDFVAVDCEAYLYPDCDIAGLGVSPFRFASNLSRSAFQSISKACFQSPFCSFPMPTILSKRPSETRFSPCMQLPSPYPPHRSDIPLLKSKLFYMASSTSFLFLHLL